MEAVKEKISLARCKDFLDGDKPTKCFFQQFRKNGLKPKRIDAILDENNAPVEGLDKMLEIASNFFQELFLEIDSNDQLTEYFLQFIEPLSVGNAQLRNELCSDFTLKDVKDAVFFF